MDVENVKQLTYEELCSDFLNEDISLIDEDKKLIMSISNEKSLQYEKFKVSMEFKEVLDKFLQEMKENIISEKGIIIKGYEVIPSNIIKEIYSSIEESNVYNDIKSKLDRTNLILAKYIDDNYDEIIAKVKEQYQRNIDKSSKDDSKNELDKLNFIEKEVKTGCKTSVKKYFSSLIPNIINVYIKFLANINKYISLELYNNIKAKVQRNIVNIKARKVEFEDLSALIYLKCKILGVEPYEKYRQVAIDEAQDFGDFSFYALKCLLKMQHLVYLET